VKHQSRKVSLLRHCLLHFVPCLRSNFGGYLSFIRLTFVAVKFQDNERNDRRRERHPLPLLYLQRRRRKLIRIVCWLPSSMFAECRMPDAKTIPSSVLWNTMALPSFMRISSTWQQPISMPYSVIRVEPLSLWRWISRWHYEHSLLSIIISPARSVEVLTSSMLLQDNSKIPVTPSVILPRTLHHGA